MSHNLAYSRKQLTRAVNLSAFLGWACVSIPLSLQSNIGVLIWAAVIGLPIAFLCCWLIGAPILKRAMKKKISWLGAICWGSAIAFVIALIGIAFGRYRGWRQSTNPNFNSQLGGGEYVREVDGILTTYGWLMLGKSTFMFVSMGAFVALLVWWIVGKPIDPSNTEA
ncbi:MAG: hypothetical protein AAGF28_10595 [Pseudomonadota bacterium]